MKNSVVIASPHKVGSTWLFNLIAGLGYKRQQAPNELRKNPNLGLLDLSLDNCENFLASATVKSVFKSHSFPPSYEISDNVALVSIIRDPRDLLVSKAFHSANLAEENGGQPFLKELSDQDKISFFLDSNTEDLDLLFAWMRFDNALTIKYEELLTNKIEILSSIASYLEVDKTEEALAKIIDSFSIEQMREHAPETRKSFFRKGVSGDWKNYFDEALKDKLKLARSGKWNDFLIEAGYEKDKNW
ncbi:sulfotransferase domain-containing protein [Alteromonas sp. 1_MG-2023]|uniref:sulfotransferase domain-containing protein n=1 Tax=Alteromonas sp. 1_MG-2023 TaxID=3062669 RepID=UPI0026E34935|nr:sulfotransferase domain-containing protein [Alteromonas sp. 1_MG-2023]MDO6567909.1 sulfotransferase domain-containing protein [Alteromonas sp. 1_MG-2023]